MSHATVDAAVNTLQSRAQLLREGVSSLAVHLGGEWNVECGSEPTEPVGGTVAQLHEIIGILDDAVGSLRRAEAVVHGVATEQPAARDEF